MRLQDWHQSLLGRNFQGVNYTSLPQTKINPVKSNCKFCVSVHPKPPVAESSCSNAKSNLGGNITCANVLSVFGRNATLNCNYNEAAGDKVSLQFDDMTYGWWVLLC